jgi:hypothetical protein
MSVIKCDNGHFYDDAKHKTCPHCETPPPIAPRRAVGEGVTMFGALVNDAPRAKVHVDMPQPATPQDERTIGIFRAEKGCDPVVGWLVCVEGREKGRDFRLRAGRNEIGRALRSDVALVDDERVSRHNHCSIIFEPRRCTFHLVYGDGECFINGKPLGESAALREGERMEIGGSAFVFVPFCKEGRTW